MSYILRLDSQGARLARRHKDLIGKKKLARGAYSAIFEGTRPDRVLKLTVDAVSYWMFNDGCGRLEHRHFPRIFNSYGDVGEVRIGDKTFPLYLYEMELLYKVKNAQAKTLAQMVRRNLSDSICRTEVGADSNLGDPRMAMNIIEDFLLKTATLPDSLWDAFKNLRECVRNADLCLLDLHSKNFMQRADGDLVLIDPVMDVNVWNASWRRRC